MLKIETIYKGGMSGTFRRFIVEKLLMGENAVIYISDAYGFVSNSYFKY